MYAIFLCVCVLWHWNQPGNAKHTPLLLSVSKWLLWTFRKTASDLLPWVRRAQYWPKALSTFEWTAPQTDLRQSFSDAVIIRVIPNVCLNSDCHSMKGVPQSLESLGNDFRIGTLIVLVFSEEIKTQQDTFPKLRKSHAAERKKPVRFS